MSEFMLTLSTALKLLLLGGACFIAGRVYQDCKDAKKMDEYRKMLRRYVYPKLRGEGD